MTLLSVLVATTRATFQKTDISYARSVTYIKRLMMRTPLLMQHKVPARSRLSSLLTCFQTLFPSIISTSSPLTSDTSCIARSLVEYDLLRSSLIWAGCTRHLARTDHRTWVPGRRGLRLSRPLRTGRPVPRHDLCAALFASSLFQLSDKATI